MRSIANRLWKFGGFIRESVYKYLQARDTGRPSILKKDNVRFHNSLQALNAERFVISSVNDFADVAEIVENEAGARLVHVKAQSKIPLLLCSQSNERNICSADRNFWVR